MWAEKVLELFANDTKIHYILKLEVWDKDSPECSVEHVD